MKKTAVMVSCFGFYKNRILPMKEELTTRGYEVSVFLSDFSHINKKEIEKRYDECEYINVISYQKNLSVKRLVSHFKFSYDVYKRIIGMEPNVIYILMPPNALGFFCGKYKKRNPKVQLIVDIIDLWPESMPIKSKAVQGILKPWRSMRNKAIAIADYVVTECDFFADFFKEYIEDKKHRTLHLYKTENSEIRKAVEKKMESYCTKLTDKYIALGYLGSMNHIMDIDTIVGCVSKLQERGYRISFHAIGDGVNRDVLFEKLKTIPCELHYYGKIFEEERKAEILLQCDYCFNVMKKSVQVGLTLKSIDYFSVGIPIINNIKGDTWRFVEKYGIGINCDGDFDVLVDRMEELNFDLRKNVLNIFDKYFTEAAFIEHVKEMFDTLDI